MKKKYLIAFVASAVFIIIAFLYRGRLEEFKGFGLLGLFLINLLGSATLFLPAPAIASVVAGGFLYPPILVAIVSSLGSALGEMVGFFFGQSGKKLILGKDHARWFVYLHRSFLRIGGVVIFVSALIPNPFFDAVGIMAGALSYSSFRFFLLVFLGRLIRDLGLAFLGSHL